MKCAKLLLLLLLFVGANFTAWADSESIPPPPESKPDLELTCEEADARIHQYNGKIQDIISNIEALKKAVEKAENDLVVQQANLEDCNKQILALVGASEADLEAFRQKLGIIEGKIRQMKNLSNDVLADRRADVVALEAELNNLRKEKISLLPEFFDRIIADAKDIKGLYREKKVSGYTVGTWAQDRDCLWNISGKMEIYGDPFQWPKIWQANTDIIRNPDIIYPGQVLQIPPAGPKTDDESKAERKYWRNKKVAAADISPAAGN